MTTRPGFLSFSGGSLPAGGLKNGSLRLVGFRGLVFFRFGFRRALSTSFAPPRRLPCRASSAQYMAGSAGRGIARIRPVACENAVLCCHERRFFDQSQWVIDRNAVLARHPSRPKRELRVGVVVGADPASALLAGLEQRFPVRFDIRVKRTRLVVFWSPSVALCRPRQPR